MPSYPISSIFVNRDRRIRREVKQEDIEIKADSLSRIGLIHPICIKSNGELVAGETRLLAAKSLGWTSIEVTLREDLSEDEALAIELEENTKRKDLDWKDQCDALLRFHQLKLRGDPTWTQEQTAVEIGLAQTTVSKQLMVAQELALGNEKVSGTKEYSVALGLVKRAKERKAADELSLILAPQETIAKPASPIQCADFLEWVQTYSGAPFNLISCDFPYGIDADKFNQGSAEKRGGYDDSEEVYWRLTGALILNRKKLLGGSGHVLFWFSMRHYTRTLELLSQYFRVDPYPLIWFKNDNTGTLPDPQRGPRRVYEVALLCSYGDRKIISAVANTFAAPVTRLGDHMSEKSQPMQEHFFRMFIDEGTRFLDPTCGSGSSLRAARALGCRHMVGLEKNSDFAKLAQEAFDK